MLMFRILFIEVRNKNKIIYSSGKDHIQNYNLNKLEKTTEMTKKYRSSGTNWKKMENMLKKTLNYLIIEIFFLK